ncbi:formimidoylglutamase [Vibrio sp. ZSDZ34]|uniref:Formimidoylglutamase n=1 Tax=Vibrio gelatinilyticus TaxID=2893468 RepID=A0A9X1WGE7_9VIBR|nr:formimidoylglutamase [Vibrio gelatinilyticus]MCJ2376184.1 formimidoylglutamase [Vibrio gelatinilyticus]
MSNTNDVLQQQLRRDFIWSGRTDKEDGLKGLRVHNSVIQAPLNGILQQDPSVVLIGFETDTGVKRNQGRIGAAKGPNHLRQCLANFAWPLNSTLIDAGNIACQRGELEQGQATTALVISQLLDQHFVITLGGGHEIAWSSFSGLAQHLRQHEASPRIGIINFDAHFDLREYRSDEYALCASSGTPFTQISDYCLTSNLDFNYLCIGVSPTSNTQALYNKARELHVGYIEDSAINSRNEDAHLATIQHFIDTVDVVYLTIDLDVFPAAQMPGVSAPAAFGVSYENLWPLIAQVLKNKHKLKLADLAELNPDFDIDNHSGRLAARLCWEIARTMSVYSLGDQQPNN